MSEAVLLSMRMEGSPTPLIFHVKVKQEIQSEKRPCSSIQTSFARRISFCKRGTCVDLNIGNIARCRVTLYILRLSTLRWAARMNR